MKNAVLIGASGYIGTALKKELVSNGFDVLGTRFKDNTDPSLLQLDITNTDSIKSFTKEVNSKINNLDALIICHSALEEQVLSSLDKGSQLDTIDLELSTRFVIANTINILLLLKGLLPLLKNNDFSNLIVLGSLVGKKALNAPLSFSAGKAALNGIVESLSKELGDANILVNSIDPGMLDGGVGKFICAEDKKDYLSHCALGRLGNAEDIAHMATWIANSNTFITGKPFVLDGGL